MKNDHEDIVGRARALIDASSLRNEDKSLLLGRIPYVDPAILKMFLQVAESDPFLVDMLVKNLKKKLDAQGNLTKLSKIISQERVEFDERFAAA